MQLDEVFSLYYVNKIHEAKNTVRELLNQEEKLELKLLEALINLKLENWDELENFLRNHSPELHYLSTDQIFKLSLIHARYHLLRHEYEEFRYYLDKAKDVYRVFENIWSMGLYIPEFFEMQAQWENINGHTKEAILILETCIQINQALGNLNGLGSNHRIIGNIHSRQGYHENSLNHYFQALSIFDDIDDNFALVNCYIDVGDILLEKGNLTHSLEFYNHAISISEKNSSILKLKPKILNEKGKIAYMQGKFQEATNYFSESLNIKQDYEDFQGLASIYLNLGRVFRAQGDLENALDYFDKVKEFKLDSLYIQDQIITYNELIITQCKLGRIDEAKKILNYMSKLISDSSDEQSRNILTFAKAMIMKHNPNVVFHLSARNVFLTMFETESLFYEIRIQSLLQIIELDINTTDQFIPPNWLKLDDLLDMLYKISQENSLIFYLVQVLIIKARLAQKQQNQTEAILLANQAEIMAKEHSMYELLNNITNKTWSTILEINPQFSYQEIIRGDLSELITYAM